MVDYVRCGSTLLAIIVPGRYAGQGVRFFTPHDFSQQLAYMSHPAGREIEPHVHNPAAREVTMTQEVLVIRRGKLRVDFYDTDLQYFESRLLEAGDVILLVAGGHGFHVVEELEMIEVKQGPYMGDGDKTRFAAVDPADVAIKPSRS